jgi:hypothetical protein
MEMEGVFDKEPVCDAAEVTLGAGVLEGERL